MIETRVHGSVESGFEPVQQAFAANFERHGEAGAACSVYVGGKKVVDIWGGTYAPDTLQLVMSTTKGVVAAAGHILAQEGRLDFDAPVTEYWPEFRAEGKQDVKVRWLFSHRAGLPAVDRPLTLDDVLAWDPVVDALAAQRPLWEPNAGHGYHVGTYGWLAGEVIRRVAGVSVGRFVHERIAQPLGLDLWIGLPEDKMSRVAPILPAPPPAPGQPVDVFTARLLDPTTLLHRAFVNPPLAVTVFNTPAFLAAEIPAANGITDARSLARMYAACIGQVDGVRLLTSDTLAGASRQQASGEDLVLGYDTRYGTGFQLSFPFRPMAGEGSFGHYGMGGSVGFAHPERGLAFAYVMSQMLPSGGVDPRTRNLVDAVLGCL
ncbi:MAG TPA: serine hydrolase domain-containing protein [Candidatus Limnocylindrales bacterium]|nr:serine hydrolase domain-containing protein [Candidatus Limnocylindrales bacterium]